MSADPPDNIPELLRSLVTNPYAVGGATLLGGLAGGGGAAYMANREQNRPGETPEERKARILRNAAFGGLMGATGVGGSLYGTALLTNPVKSHYNPDSLVGRWINSMREDGSTMATGVLGAGAGGMIGSALHSKFAPKVSWGGAGKAALRGAKIGGATGVGVSFAPAVLDYFTNTYDKMTD